MNELVRNVGAPVRRYDGPLKVTGAAKYAAEFGEAGLLHGYVVFAAIATGRDHRHQHGRGQVRCRAWSRSTRTRTASKGAAEDEKWQDAVAPPGIPLRPLGDDRRCASPASPWPWWSPTRSRRRVTPPPSCKVEYERAGRAQDRP